VSNIKDVAKLAKVSIASVSRYLNSPEIVKPSTRMRIQEAIKALNYRPSIIAQSMRNQATKYIAMILEDMSNPFYTEVLNGAEHRALESGYNIVVLNTNKDVKKKNYYYDIIFRRGFIGVIYCLTMYKEDEKILKNLKMKDIHFVLIQNELFKNKHTCVNTDNFKAAYDGTNYLISSGHKDIAIVGFNSFYDQVDSRRGGYTKALSENSIKYDPSIVFDTELSIDGGIEIAKEIIKLKNEITAIFCLSDLIAIGVIKYFNSKNIRIPEDISILGFDDIEWSKVMEPGLTTIHQRKKTLGYNAVGAIISSINSSKLQDSIILDTYIVKRETVKEKNRNGDV